MTALITPASVPSITWQQALVITTELLAKLYRTDANNIQQNYSRNADRFVEGKHFFKVAGQDLKDLRPSLSQSQISPKARSIMLWTERGAARHAKMLETDEAWDVFEALEDHYFQGPRPRKPRAPRAKALNTRQERHALRHYAVEMELSCRLSPPKALQLLGCYAGVKRLDLISPDTIPEVEGFAARAIDHQTSDEDWKRVEHGRQLLAESSPQLELAERQQD
jgi:hypothetical protein